MADHTPYPESLRSEYDRELQDIALRKRNASRLYRALLHAGLWKNNIRLLDVGSGTGILLSALGSNAKLRVACDLRRNIFILTRQQLKNILFAQCDGCALPFPDGHFELVTCLAVIDEISNWQTALADMGRCVAPGGILYITIVNGQWLLKIYSIIEFSGLPSSGRLVVIRQQSSYKPQYFKAGRRDGNIGYVGLAFHRFDTIPSTKSMALDTTDSCFFFGTVDTLDLSQLRICLAEAESIKRYRNGDNRNVRNNRHGWSWRQFAIS